MSRRYHIDATINGIVHRDDVEARLLLVHWLRDVLDLTGTHIGCDTSQCGACTVLLNGESVKACTVLAVQVNGCEVTTIEGLAPEGGLHPIQEGFWEKHGLQCGFCTPGMIMAVYDLLQRNSNPTEKEIRAALQGNICRCTGYQNIVKAIQYAIQKMQTDQHVLVAVGRRAMVAQASSQEEDTEYLSVTIWNNPDVPDIVKSANAFLERQQKIISDNSESTLRNFNTRFSGGPAANLDQSTFVLPLDSSDSKTKEQWLAEGQAHFNATRYDQALQACMEALNKDSDYCDAYFEMARALEKLGYTNESTKARKQAERLGCI